ncbi:MAG: hypothetical protein EP344_04375 [Bacteroidetes bacterium]|nr:MAG: hypothetical protein EP344_04375 [Bacteroidota bacterium]
MKAFLPTVTCKSVFSGIVIFLLFSPALLRAQGGGCECTNCPQFLPDLFVGPFYINIQNADNPTLGQGGQGVCGVIVNFDHTAICDLSITLTSPSGQVVTLIGPIGQFCTTNGNAGTEWNVTFLPCGDAVNPDPGFSDTWNNNQPWGANNYYSGSYYPFSGCLENFSGPVNGTWTLTVTDGQANDVGNLIDYEIIFCDPSGINCFSCAADAGNLLQPDVIACEGDPSLNLDLPPTYIPPLVPPPAADYGYTYVVGGTGGVIMGYEPDADLSAYPAGNYTVCGMSYLLAQVAEIPDPNGVLTVNQLATQLNSTQPPFCGKITNNCVNVTIKPLPPDEEEYQTICAPACYDFHGVEYCQSGTYTQTLYQNDCPYTATLYLTVNQPSFKTVVETICPDGCSVTPGFAGVCGAGQYEQTFINAAGCDSIVTLNLVNINVVANINSDPPPVLDCLQPTAQLFGSGSSVGAGVSYLWTASNGGAISGPVNGINATITAPGDYQLQVCQTLGAVTCCDSASITVTGSQTLPNTPSGLVGDTILCPGQDAVFSVPPDSSATSFTWTVPQGVNINAGQDSASIDLTWNDTSGVVCVSAVNACGSSMPFCQPVSVLPLADPDTLQGAVSVCIGDTVTYNIAPVAGAQEYQWTVPASAVILTGQGSPGISVWWESTDTGDICVVASNACDTSQSACLPVQVTAVPVLPDITGDSTLCAGTNGVYTISGLVNATTYTWTVPTGGSVLSGQDSTTLEVAWAAAPGGNVCVTAGNGCGTGPEDCFPVSIFEVPLANAGLDSAVCDSSSTLAATISVAGSSGQWTLSTGPGMAGFSSPDSVITAVTVSATGTYAFLWTESNSICLDSDTVVVQFNPAPQTGPVLSACDAANQNYTVSFPVFGGTAPYMVPGGTIVNDTFYAAPIPAGQPYSFIVMDTNGCVSPVVSGLVQCNCATNAGQMDTQLLGACPGDSVTAQHQGGTLDGDDIGAFILHTNPGPTIGTLLAVNTTGTFGFGTGMSFGTTYYISYVAGNNVNGFPDLMDPCLSVAAGQPVVFYSNPMADGGADVAGCGLTLSVNGNPGVDAGIWSVINQPPGGMAVLADPQDPFTSVMANVFGDYALNFTVVNSNGCIGMDTVLLIFQEAPAAGSLMQVCDGANQFYTVDFPINGGTAPFQVNGVPLAGSAYTSAPIASGTAFNFIITDANGCTSPDITGTFNCACATSAGQLDLSLISACADDTVSANYLGGQYLDANDTLAFVLHTGSGTSLGTVFAQNQTGVFAYQPGMNFGTTYYMSVVVGDNLNGLPDTSDPCLAVAQGQPIVFYENPVPDAGSAVAVCGLSTNLNAVNSGFSGSWSQVSGPGTSNLTNSQDPGTAVTVSVAGTYVFRWTETNNICVVSAEVTLDFYDVPTLTGLVETCNGTNTGFALEFSVTGGTAPFFVSGASGMFTGNVFTSTELPNNSTYNLIVTDANGCMTPGISGSYFCPCTTNAGTMVTTPAVFCADQLATAVWNNDATLDADDSLQFILVDLAGTIYGTNNQPAFSFGPGLQTNVTYFITAVAGNNSGGQIDPNDPCLDIAQGAPIQWKPLPAATLTGDATICQGSSTVLQFAGSGSYPLSVTYLDGAGMPASLVLTGTQSADLSVSPTVTTTYSLVSVTDGTSPACSQALSGAVTVTVNTPVTAGTAGAPAEFCAGSSQLVPLASLLNSADPGGQWTETSAMPSLPGGFQAAAGSFQTSGQPAGTYTFRYEVEGAAPCPDESSTVTVVVHDLPVADAGPDKTITCNQTTVTLGGTGTSAGIYSWTQQGAPVGSSAQVTTGNGGVYTLLVTNTAGCTASDAVTVVVDNVPPIAYQITVEPVSCFGDRNGRIILDSVVSSNPPVLFSLNGGPYVQQPVFTGLAPDTYVVTLQDVNGCEWSTSDLNVNEPSPLTVDLGPTLEVELGDQVLVHAETTVPFSALQSVTWNPVLDSLHADTLIQVFRPFESGQVGVLLMDTSGCSASSNVLVLVDRTRKVYVPNVIKPGSGLNDQLVVFGGQDVAEVEVFRVYDRWGTQLFEATGFQANDLNSGWDGTFRGNPLNPGVYVYYVVVRFIDGESVLFRGDVTVVR